MKSSISDVEYELFNLNSHISLVLLEQFLWYCLNCKKSSLRLSFQCSPINSCVLGHGIAIWKKHARVSYSKTITISRVPRTASSPAREKHVLGPGDEAVPRMSVTNWSLWKINECLFTKYCRWPLKFIWRNL
jgi:hypothetical protein